MTVEAEAEEELPQLNGVILERMERASKEIPYVEEDDEMFLGSEEIKED